MPKRFANVLMILLSLIAFTLQAGGRYQDPPENIDKVIASANQALNALKQGQSEAALTAAQEALKFAKDSNEAKTTAAMQRATSNLRMIVGKIKRGEAEQAQAQLQEIIAYLDEILKSYQ